MPDELPTVSLKDYQVSPETTQQITDILQRWPGKTSTEVIELAIFRLHSQTIHADPKWFDRYNRKGDADG